MVVKPTPNTGILFHLAENMRENNFMQHADFMNCEMRKTSEEKDENTPKLFHKIKLIW